MRFSAFIVSCFLLVSLGCGSNAASSAEHDLNGAILPNADLVLYVDGVTGNAAPISRAMREGNEDPAEALIEVFPGIGELIEATGLHGDSLQYLIGSVSGIGATVESGAPDAVRFALAARLDAALDPALVLQTLTEVSENPDVAFTVAAEDHAAGSAIAFKMDGDAQSPDILLLIENDDAGSTLRLATREELTLAARTGIALPAAFEEASKGIPEDSYFWLAMLLPEEAREQLRQQPPNPMMGGADAAFHNLQSLVFSGIATETLALRLGATFTTDEEATLVRGFLQGSIMPMAMMMFSQSPDGPPPALSTLAFSAEGPQVGISITFTKADLVKMTDGAGAF